MNIYIRQHYVKTKIKIHVRMVSKRGVKPYNMAQKKEVAKLIQEYLYKNVQAKTTEYK